MALVLAGLGGYYADQKYSVSRVVGNGFCSSLTTTSNVPTSDISYYLREARLASRTKRDASLIKVWEQFVAATAVASQAHEDADSAWKDSFADLAANPIPCVGVGAQERQNCVDSFSAKLLTQANSRISLAEREKDSISKMQTLLPAVEKEYGAVCANPDGLKGLNELGQQLNLRSASIAKEVEDDTAYAEKIRATTKLQDEVAEAKAAAARAQAAVAQAAQDKRDACISPLLAELSEVEKQANEVSERKADLVIGCPSDPNFTCLTPDQRSQAAALSNQQAAFNHRETELQNEINKCNAQ